MTDTTSIPTIPPFLNHTMEFLLESPVHGLLSKTLMLITFTGRKTGKMYTTPVSYSQFEDLVYVFTHANWWKNLSGGAQVMLHIRGRQLEGIADTVAEDKEAVTQGLATHLRSVRSDARYYGVTFDDHGNPNADEVEMAAQTVVMIRIRLC